MIGDSDFAEFLMGHSTALTRAYRQMKPEDKAVNYQQLMPNITIFETQSDLRGLTSEVEGVKKENREMRQPNGSLHEQLKRERHDNSRAKEKEIRWA